MFFPALDVPPEQQEMVECAISAAIKYEIPANIMLAVAEKEGGKTGQWVRNSNGTYDVGYMQFNTAYLKSLKKYGIEAKHVAAGGCYSYLITHDIQPRIQKLDYNRTYIESVS